MVLHASGGSSRRHSRHGRPAGGIRGGECALGGNGNRRVTRGAARFYRTWIFFGGRRIQESRDYTAGGLCDRPTRRRTRSQLERTRTLAAIENEVAAGGCDRFK